MSQPGFTYIPSKGERFLDRIIAAVAPRIAYKREVARRELHYFRYASARSNEGRKNTRFQNISGETAIGNRERLQMQWNAIELVENSGLAEGIRKKFVQYVAGSLRFQALTGNKTVNKIYEDYVKSVTGKSVDLSGENSLRRLAGLVISGIIVKGDSMLNVVRQGREIKLQGIEADRIGNPLDWKASDSYVGGVHLDEYGRHIAYDIFTRDRNVGIYRFTRTLERFDKNGMPCALLSKSPLTFDCIRGRTLFKTAIDNISYLRDMRNYELQAMIWASSRSGVFHTHNGQLPEQLPFDESTNAGSPATDANGNASRYVTIKPNTLTALGIGEDVTLHQNDRPSPNVINMYHDTTRELCNGLGISYGLGYNMAGLTGPAVRAVNKQDSRTFHQWQGNLEEDTLDPVGFQILANGIAWGEIPWHPEFYKFGWIFPADISIDGGRDTTSDLALRRAGLLAGSEITREASMDLDEVQAANARETQNLFELAENMRRNLAAKGIEVTLAQCMSAMIPEGSGGKSFMEGAAVANKAEAEAEAAAIATATERPGATSEGADLD